MGYNLLRVGEYEKSIPNFQNALQIESNYGYAYDNLGYALIQLGRLEEAKQQLDHARSTENNELAYSARNLALYYQALEFHYAKFLICKGETHMGIEYLEKAVEIGEPEAIALKNELKDK